MGARNAARLTPSGASLQGAMAHEAHSCPDSALKQSNAGSGTVCRWSESLNPACIRVLAGWYSSTKSPATP